MFWLHDFCMATLAFQQIILDQEGPGFGVYKQAGVAIKDGGVLAPNGILGFAPVGAAAQGNNIVFSLMNQSATETRKLAIEAADYGLRLTVTLSGVATIANTAAGARYALGLDATTGHYFANSAVSTTPFFEITEFAPNDLNGRMGDTNVRVRCRVNPLV